MKSPPKLVRIDFVDSETWNLYLFEGKDLVKKGFIHDAHMFRNGAAARLMIEDFRES